MKAVPYHSNNPSMPVWVTIDEAAEIIKKRNGVDIKPSEIWRYALYGHLTLSIYFQSPILIRQIKVERDKVVLINEKNDIISKLSYLNVECFLKENNWRVKTVGDYIVPSCHVIDTPLLGCEYVALQKMLAHSLNLPNPGNGRSNIYCGILVCEGENIFQVFEYEHLERRVTHQLKSINAYDARLLLAEIKNKSFIEDRKDYFPIYEFPADACFVVNRKHLDSFIDSFFPLQVKPSTHISTPLSRLLWLACKHNDHTGPLIDQPYKLLSVFEAWAVSNGITDRLSGDTLKKALQRGAPF
ncbi:hypothetical protein NNV51_002911 [Salmonella enterica]|nr:hypothetical protein [Salmonella enterica]